MIAISYKEFAELCRIIVENCTGFDTKGEIDLFGLRLRITFGVEGIELAIDVLLDSESNRWRPSFEVQASIGLEDSAENRTIMDIIEYIPFTLSELKSVFSAYEIDFMTTYKSDDFKKCEWDFGYRPDRVGK